MFRTKPLPISRGIFGPIVLLGQNLNLKINNSKGMLALPYPEISRSELLMYFQTSPNRLAGSIWNSSTTLKTSSIVRI